MKGRAITSPICRFPGRCPNSPPRNFGNPGTPLGERAIYKYEGRQYGNDDENGYPRRNAQNNKVARRNCQPI